MESELKDGLIPDFIIPELAALIIRVRVYHGPLFWLLLSTGQDVRVSIGELTPLDKWVFQSWVPKIITTSQEELLTEIVASTLLAE